MLAAPKMASAQSDKEDQLQNAVVCSQLGVYSSLRQTALATGVARSTLGHRLAGRPSRAQTHLRSSRLTAEQEEVLTRFIEDLQLQYAPINHAQLRVIASNLAGQNGPGMPLGKCWITRFIKRQRTLNNGRSIALTKDRIQAAIPTQIQGWFEHYQEVVQRYSIQPENIYNLDEIGFQMGHSQHENVVFNYRLGQPKSLTTGQTAWVSSLECISATGHAITPLVIHRGTVSNAPFDHWFPPSYECPNWFYGFTKKGWTSNEYSLGWLTEVFLPKTYNGGNWRLLLLDGHGSHITGEFQYECLVNQVILIYLLPHSSHLLQPCDLGPFAHLKRAYSNHLKAYISQGKAQLSRPQFNLLYERTRRAGLTEQYIKAGWSRTGLYPYNPQRVLQSNELVRFRPTTPDLLPPPSAQYLTPTHRAEFDSIAQSIQSTLSPIRSHQFTRLRHAYIRESTARICLQKDESTARKETYTTEERAIQKRLRKTDDSMLWNLREVMSNRGHPDKEIEQFLDQQPNREPIYNAQIDQSGSTNPEGPS